jgi:tellurite resistance protein
MAKKHKRPTITTADLVAEYFDQRDEQLMQALVAAGAFVALADGRVKDVERRELLSYVEGNDLVPTIARQDIIEAFDNRVREIEDRGSANVIVEAFRPLVGRSPSSFLVRVAERVAAADGYLHPNELQTIELVRLIVTNAPSNRPQSSVDRSLCAPSEATAQV